MKYLVVLLLMFTACSSQEKEEPQVLSEKKEERKKQEEVKIDKKEMSDNLFVVPQKEIPENQFPSPLASIKELDRKIEKYNTSQNLTPEQIESNKKLKEEIIRGTFDIYELSRLALDSHWESLDEKERVYFANLMTRLLERKAIFSKEQVKDNKKPYTVTYQGESFLDAEKNKSKVESQLNVPSEKMNLKISYNLKKTPYGWKIYDVIVDDASLVENYKFQFHTIIKKNGYDDLIDRMEKKLKKI